MSDYMFNGHITDGTGISGLSWEQHDKKVFFVHLTSVLRAVPVHSCDVARNSGGHHSPGAQWAWRSYAEVYPDLSKPLGKGWNVQWPRLVTGMYFNFTEYVDRNKVYFGNLQIANIQNIHHIIQIVLWMSMYAFIVRSCVCAHIYI